MMDEVVQDPQASFSSVLWFIGWKKIGECHGVRREHV